jgi:aspartate/tyrosine/aromatic aminotransferase
MRERVQKMREEFSSDLIKRCDKKDYSYLLSKKGMFCFSDLNKDQVQKLRDEYAIYMTKTGRINLSGLIKQNMRFTIDSILSVM